MGTQLSSPYTGQHLKSDVIIIGAGISGIAIAQNLKDAVIVEKSRGIGGRIASRRLNDISINHGPHCYTHSQIKHEARDLNIRQSFEVTHFEILSDRIKVYGSSNEAIDCKKLIITAPAPQAKVILERSKLNASFLDGVRYSSVIQFMTLLDESIVKRDLESFVTPTKQNGLYEFHRFLNEILLDYEKEDIKDCMLSYIRYSKSAESHVHKWRYAEVLESIEPSFQSYYVSQNIILAGDYFGTKGIESALESAQNALKILASSKD